VHDVCIHAVDVLQSWFGEAPEEVYGNWSRPTTSRWRA